MFGVIITFSFYLRTNSGIHVEPSIGKANLVVFGILLLYFLSNWVTANFLRPLINFTAPYVFSWTIGIWYLGATVIMTNSVGKLKYSLVGLYIIAVALYDFIAFRRTCFYKTKPSALLWMSLAGVTLVLGLYFMISTGLSHVGIATTEEDIRGVAIIVLAFFTIVRGGLRFWLVLGRSENE